MRLAIAVLLLVGSVVGQNAGKVQIVSDCSLSKDGRVVTCVGHPKPEHHPGDCYRVKQDGTLEKVLHCDNDVNYYDLVEHGDLYDPSKLVDLPAVLGFDGVKDCTPCENGWFGGIRCKAICAPDVYSCADKFRILLTSEDGKHWCHKVQP